MAEILKYKFNEKPHCPHCGEPLDDCPARDFIVFGMDGNPSTRPSEDQCGWCDEYFSAKATAPDEITFTPKHN